MKLIDANIGTKVLFIGPGMNPDQIMVISEDSHWCGWPERITYINSDMEIERSGCAACEAEWEVPARAPSSGSQED